MSTPYAGNPAAFPTDYLIPDDGESKNATSVNVALEALGDRTAYLKARAINTIAGVPQSTGPVAATFSTASATDVDITGMTLTIADCEIGDILVIQAHLQVWITNNAGGAAAYTTKVINGATTDSAAIGTNTQATLPPSISHSWQFTVAHAGAVTVKGTLRTTNVADTAHLGGDGYLTVIKVRP